MKETPLFVVGLFAAGISEGNRVTADGEFLVEGYESVLILSLPGEAEASGKAGSAASRTAERAAVRAYLAVVGAAACKDGDDHHKAEDASHDRKDHSGKAHALAVRILEGDDSADKACPPLCRTKNGYRHLG